MKVAIIGSGISGLGIAYLLRQKYEITLYEKNLSLGGHSRTINVQLDNKSIPVDTGFIVFNHKKYPHLSALFKLLDVPIEKSHMSFGVSIDNAKIEYGTKNPYRLFAQKANLLKPEFWMMLNDIIKFNRSAKQYLNTELTLGECLTKLRLGAWFKNYYLLPMGASIWSTSMNRILDFPASSFIQFFDNHGLLSINNQPQWYTVKGGSRVYIEKLIANFKDNIKHHCEVTEVIRTQKHIIVKDTNGKQEAYDEVVLACHSDQALKLLKNPTNKEKQTLTAIQYQSNQIIVHQDIRFLPKRRNAWSSWNYLGDKKQDSKTISLSYWMNNLQPLNTKTPVIITLNPIIEPKADLIFDRYTFEHPVFDSVALKAQDQINSIQGQHKVWFTGAWQKYGFHEDGLLSSVNVAKKMGIKIPWI